MAYRDAFYFYAKYTLYHLGKTPKQVIIEFLRITDFKELFTKMHSECKQSASTVELDAEFAIALCCVHLEELAEKVLSESFFKKVPDEAMRLLKAASKDPQYDKGEHLVVKHIFNLSNEYVKFLDSKASKIMVSLGAENMLLRHGFHAAFCDLRT